VSNARYSPSDSRGREEARKRFTFNLGVWTFPKDVTLEKNRLRIDRVLEVEEKKKKWRVPSS